MLAKTTRRRQRHKRQYAAPLDLDGRRPMMTNPTSFVGSYKKIVFALSRTRERGYVDMMSHTSIHIDARVEVD
jgi:hypothetical protein